MAMSLGLDQDTVLNEEVAAPPLADADEGAHASTLGTDTLGTDTLGTDTFGADKPPRICVQAAADDRQAGSAFPADDRESLRRWVISLVVVVLAHAAVAAVVLTWRQTTKPAEQRGPIMVDLAPALAPPVLPRADLPAAPEVSADRPTEKAEAKREEKTAARSEENTQTKPGDAVPSMVSPVTPMVPISPEGQNGTQAPAAGELRGPAAAPPQGGSAAPIDTRIAEQRRERFKKAGRTSDWKTAIMPRAPKAFAGRHQPAGAGAASGLARNAIGMAVPNGAGANGTTAPGASAAASLPAASGVNGTTTNAIGISTPNYPTVAGVPRPAIGAVASIGTPTVRSGINGTSMTRPGASTGAVGGPAKTVAGVINGTGIRPRP
jgi:hypothetical protein